MKLNHLLIPYIAALVFILGSVAGSGGLAWYRTLALPGFAPSEGLIALLWLLIYACAALAALIIWNQTPRDGVFTAVMSGFALAGAVNLAWSLLFFWAHELALSAVAAVALSIIVLGTACIALSRSARAAMLLLPFAAWTLFAAYFIAALAALNP